MSSFKRLTLASVIAGLVSLSSLAAAAPASLDQQLQAARQEGSIWTALALNRQLNGFEFGVKVDQGTATLTGAVEDEVDRELAEQVALNTQGIDKVDNRLTLNPELVEHVNQRQQFAQHLEDATLTAIIKSKLLWNTNTQALDIVVSTADGVVTLKGQAQTADAKQLAGTLATNTDGVYQVNNLISLGAADTATTRAETQAKKTEEALSDTWVTSKIKASLLLNRDLDGLSIDVETRTGMVTLKGDVASSEQKTLAVEVARNIRGVRGVDADLLKISKPII
ncbi:BON domain-containing protein [Pseudomonas sp. PvP001]|jgi:osmotically-inducible protein OsmY|uniref:BON domain-containing protein n=1 Tax=Pseudomonas sp. PvP001 TaxID=3158559 RepID=UPI00339A7B34